DGHATGKGLRRAAALDPGRRVRADRGRGFGHRRDRGPRRRHSPSIGTLRPELARSKLGLEFGFAGLAVGLTVTLSVAGGPGADPWVPADRRPGEQPAAPGRQRTPDPVDLSGPRDEAVVPFLLRRRRLLLSGLPHDHQPAGEPADDP